MTTCNFKLNIVMQKDLRRAGDLFAIFFLLFSASIYWENERYQIVSTLL